MIPHHHIQAVRGFDPIGAATEAVGGAAATVQGAVGTATQAAEGAVGTATQAVGGAVATATQAVAGAVSTATGLYNNATGMLGMLNKIEKLITTLEGYWDQYKICIEIGIIAFIAIVVLSILYCCFHCWFDFFHYCCCYLRCTWCIEQWCWHHRGPCVSLCKSCCNKELAEKECHPCTRFCLWTVPNDIRIAREKIHGDLRKGWCDTTHVVGRKCGKIELSNDPEERANWFWWGKQGEPKPAWVEYCCTCFTSSERYAEKAKDRLKKEVRKAEERNIHFSKLASGLNAWGEKVEDKFGQESRKLLEGVHKGWAENVGAGHVIEQQDKTDQSNVNYDQWHEKDEIKALEKEKEKNGEEDKPRQRRQRDSTLILEEGR